ncbi:crossover junction endodeoxyribonuclease RuvC [Desulfonatronovibrio hydrogenovorans]|uniref:crossover junction endodeoxyribonuclease RuvC n=1 Tax=Desulfonatronovibrio hydrogenovorans TaxID=53245 RepID=UPI00048D0388|nr:crossover junction endodeoxyribonuclease RuvC [Desulfonatronovibrio hydrogenovorans]
MTSTGESIILGIDPGSRCTGYGIVKEVSGRLSLVKAGTIRPDQTGDMSVRLAGIFAGISSLVQEFRPAEAAVEEVFTARNASSALKLGQARGAAVVACSHLGIPVFSYEPTMIKKSVVGVGRADKDQVAFMVARLLGARDSLARDATDALAVAVTHLNHRRLTRLKGWK